METRCVEEKGKFLSNHYRMEAWWCCWWKKSCTSWYVDDTSIYKVFFTSQVVQDFFHQQCDGKLMILFRYTHMYATTVYNMYKVTMYVLFEYKTYFTYFKNTSHVLYIYHPKKHGNFLQRGLTLYSRVLLDLQTTSFEIPWFLGHQQYHCMFTVLISSLIINTKNTLYSRNIYW